MTHDELQNDLAAHLRGNTDRMVWTNTQLGPAGSPRPDVFTVNKSFARFRADCYEIKVSVSDLRHDITSGKWQSYLKFGHAVWFAFPRGMVPLDMIPAQCGVILRGDGWRAARKPVPQVLETLPRDAWLKLLMDPPPSQDPTQRYGNWWQMQDVINKKMGKEAAALFDARRLADGHYQRATAELEASAAAIDAAVKKLRDDAIKDAERQQTALTNEMRALGSALGLDYDTVTPKQLVDRLQKLHWKLGTGRLDAAIKSMTDLRDVLNPPKELPAQAVDVEALCQDIG